MSEAQYQELLEKQGLHGFVIQMSTDAYRSECTRDLWLRTALAAIALLAALGLAFGWRNIDRTARLQIRLLKASEMNTYLRDMNVAAAGLAHETRNPLNIVRTHAQIITQDQKISNEIHSKAEDIIEEVDRITGRLNEFINYSKPPTPGPAPANLKTIIQDVGRALETDLEEKNAQLHVTGSDLTIMADESLLRQVLFNLLLNAIQSVDNGGNIQMKLDIDARGEGSLEVIDDGPGVPHDIRNDIFRPYFTTRDQGTGLGLAVVRQIVLAHQWDVEYIPQEHGALFRISGLKIV
jgi:signal transduction histidine kinase